MIFFLYGFLVFLVWVVSDFPIYWFSWLLVSQSKKYIFYTPHILDKPNIYIHKLNVEMTQISRVLNLMTIK